MNQRAFIHVIVLVHATAGTGLTVHPVVLELISNRQPKAGLEGKFSVRYAAATAIVA